MGNQDGKRVNVGYYATPLEAAVAFARAKSAAEEAAPPSPPPNPAVKQEAIATAPAPVATGGPQLPPFPTVVPQPPLLAPPLPASQAAALEEVRSVLKSYKLDQYAEAFEEQGYDDIPFLRSMSEDELMAVLREQIGMKPGHAMRFAMWLAQGRGLGV